MDPRDRLWHELIFKWCDGHALLSLRAVCRAFHAQLDQSRLWLRYTVGVSRMRYEERLAGWRGVERAMRREANTRVNCAAGHFVLGPAMEWLPPVIDGVSWTGRLYDVTFVCGRIAASRGSSVVLFDAATGALLKSLRVRRGRNPIDIMSRYFVPIVVLDRWIPVRGEDGLGLLLDCATAQLVEFTPPGPIHCDLHYSAAGAHFSHRCHENPLMAIVVRVTANASGGVDLPVVARVNLAHHEVLLQLCERGQAYLLFDPQCHTLQLVDLVSAQPKRSFTPRNALRNELIDCMCESVLTALDLQRPTRCT